MVAEEMKLPPENIRLWAMVNRQNKTTRPDQPILEQEMTIDDAFAKYGSRDKAFRLWVEEADKFENGKAVWPEVQLPTTNNSNATILVFLKYFDAEAQTLKGVGHVYLKKQQKVSDIVPLINQIMGWSPTSPDLTNGNQKEVEPPTISLFEEIKHSMIDPMKLKATLHQAELQDGDIVCFQKSFEKDKLEAIDASGGYTDAREFYDHLLNRKLITFSPKVVTDSEKEVFKLELSRKMVYDQFSAKVGEHLKVDPTHIRFSTVNATTGKPKAIVRRTAHQNLFQIMNSQYGQYSNNNQRDDSLYYEVLDMSLSELETKKTMRITWVSEGITREVKQNLISAK